MARCNHCGNNGTGRISCHYCDPNAEGRPDTFRAVGVMRKSIGHSDPHHIREHVYKERPGLKEAIDAALASE